MKQILLTICLITLNYSIYCQTLLPLSVSGGHHHHNGSECGVIKPDSLVEVQVSFNKENRPRTVIAQAKDGYAFIEGDIILGKIEDLQNRDYSRNIYCDGCNTWDDNIIPYTIAPDAGYNQSTLDSIDLAIETINNSTNLCIVPRTDESDYVEIINDGGCYSYVGNVNYWISPQPLSINQPGCAWVGTIIHEFLHASGIFHEQSRADRDDYVIIQYENISEGFENNFDIHDSDGNDYGTYDYESVMHYGPYAFSINPYSGDYPTITKLDGSTDGFGQRNGLSQQDIEGINNIYPSSGIYISPDQIALESIYDNTNGIDWNNVTGWNEVNCSPCSWAGVTCQNQRVITLDFSNNNLSGVMPSLDALGKLQSIFISDNQITGLPTINSDVFPDLYTVNLSDNMLGFDDLENNFDGIPNVIYGNQGNFDVSYENNELSAENAGGTITNNTYTWFKNDEQIAVIENDPTLDLTEYLQNKDDIATRTENSYRVDVTNTEIPNLVIGSNPIIVDAPLPVTLISFTGESKDLSISLSWITGSEIDNKGFTVERSADGKNFKSVGFVDGNGTTYNRKMYEFNDNNPIVGDNYYRLIQEDYDGYLETYEVLKVVYTGIRSVSIHPNVIDNGMLVVKNGDGQDMKIFDTSGKLVKEGRLSNVEEQIKIMDLTMGVYFVKIGSSSHTIFIK